MSKTTLAVAGLLAWCATAAACDERALPIDASAAVAPGDESDAGVSDAGARKDGAAEDGGKPALPSTAVF